MKEKEWNINRDILFACWTEILNFQDLPYEKGYDYGLYIISEIFDS